MSAKDKKDKILSERTFQEYTMGCFYQDELREHDFSMRQILDSLPKLSKKEVWELFDNAEFEISQGVGDWNWEIKEKDLEELITKICSLIPAGKVIAEGKYDGLIGKEKDGLTTITISFKQGKINNKLDDNMFGKEGKLVWVPDKEVEDE